MISSHLSKRAEAPNGRTTELLKPLPRMLTMKKHLLLPAVLPLIRVVRGRRVILDSDLARLYGVSTSRLNQQVRRNRRRFPVDFAFIMTRREASLMLSQIVTASKRRNRGKPPIAYTEHGAVMAANVLKSDRAAAMSVEVVRAFIRMRKILSSHRRIARILGELEAAVAVRLDRHDREIAALFEMLEALVDAGPGGPPPARRVGSA